MEQANSREMPPLRPVPPRFVPVANADDIVIPGLDTTASVEDQIEQCEQLITLRLQNIDATFADIHRILTTEILPSIKKYSLASAPIREAARFWISFFDTSARVRVNVDDDLVSPDATQDDPEEADATESGQSFRTTSDLSFHPPETTSTPLGRRHRAPDSSFQSTIESPMQRLDRELSKLSAQDQPSLSHASPVASRSNLLPRLRPRSPVHFMPPIDLSSTSESSAADYSPPVTVRLSKRVTNVPVAPPPQDASTSMSTDTSSDRHILHGLDKGKGKSNSTPLRENIFRRNLLKSSVVPSPKKSSPRKALKRTLADVGDIVDLREQPRAGAFPVYETSDEEDNTMSPPVTVKLSRPSLQLNRAPAPVAAQRVSQGVVAEVRRTEARKSLGIRGIFQPRPSMARMKGTPGRGRVQPPSAKKPAGPSTPGLNAYVYAEMFDNGPVDTDDEDDEDSFYGHGVMSIPMNSVREEDSDSSEGTSAARGGLFQRYYESSQDTGGARGSNEPTETVFGGRHVGRESNPMRILGTQLLAETIDPASTDETVPAVDQSPTPWQGRRPDFRS
ncbi:DASH complex subunit Ask1-domain-containing protein [Auriculariales sp. MPI-PUGE-AT-0066]|nr:DASH complex subunit Ask1-domain-containing protein [Auriculariales sp. MPI-PUGE-AT-0066]